MKYLIQLKDYFRDAISEMKKVTWPTKKQVKFFSLLVIGMSVGVAIFFGILDYVLNLGLEAII
ncbi:MAG: preprotein translocase subunit SecE [Candidatus Magasanikbacteria bacterium]|jgi:preprotein translocase subunit SecE|nr:preprotein translocase subunit SecE [Candidatus Magasanikbacteria bacterium]